LVLRFCSTTERVDPASVRYSLRRLARGEVVNEITIDPAVAGEAIVAPDQMLAVPKDCEGE
jgi:quinolinate synthase